MTQQPETEKSIDVFYISLDKNSNVICDKIHQQQQQPEIVPKSVVPGIKMEHNSLLGNCKSTGGEKEGAKKFANFSIGNNIDNDTSSKTLKLDNLLDKNLAGDLETNIDYYYTAREEPDAKCAKIFSVKINVFLCYFVENYT